MIWTKRPSSQFSSDSFRSDNLVGFGLGATGSGIGRLEREWELLACDDSLEKKTARRRTRTSPYLRVVGGFFLYFLVNSDVDHCGRKILLAMEIHHDLIEKQAMGVIC